MKYIATILILFICLSGYGQQFSPPITLNGREWTPTQYDTVKVIMLVCDTAYGFVNYNYHPTYWQYGYEVHEIDGKWRTLDAISYLDADKKTLPKSIIVWQSLIIK